MTVHHSKLLEFGANPVPSGAAAVSVSVNAEAWAAIDDCEAVALRAAEAAAAAVGHELAVDLSIALSSDSEIQGLNARYRQQNKPTNVLAFPNGMMLAAAGDRVFLGDVIVAYETMMYEALAENKNPRHHLCHLVVHGVLHLYGYDHDTDADAEQMETLEREILNGLDIPDPYNIWPGSKAAPEAA